MVRGAAVLLSALALQAGAACADRTVALVVGIDDYRHIPRLDGAVNDARDVADALRGIGAEVVTLTDGAATREAILREWRRLATSVGEGDRLVVTFAGHGSNEPEHWPGSEADGLDETLLLSGFEPNGPGAAERIRDDEIAELIALSSRAQTIFVADACHSGTLTRTVEPALGYRFFAHEPMIADPLPPPPPPASRSEGREEAALFLAAVDETEKVPEFLIDGTPRGALSYAFASALRGGADADHDGELTKREIEEHVRREVRAISRGLQKPQIARGGDLDSVVFQLAGMDPLPPPPPPSGIMSRDFDALPGMTVAGVGGMGLDAAPGLTPTDGAADLVFDPATGLLRSMVGDVVRDLSGLERRAQAVALRDSVDAARLARALDAVSDHRMEIAFAGGDGLYRQGDRVGIDVAGRGTPHILLFNIASDGQIAHLYPIRNSALGLFDPPSLPPQAPLGLHVEIAPPFGADTTVAVESSGPAEALHAVLARHDGRTDLRAFWEDFRRAWRGEPETPRIAVFPFFSAPR